MTHRQRYAEACKKAFEGYSPPPRIGLDRWGNPKPGAWTKESVLKLVEYCRQGLRSQDIAPLMGKSQKAIQKAFVRFGFPSLHNICPPRGADNPAWNGGVHIGTTGYRFLRRPEHPHANYAGYVMEHRLVVEEHLGRFLDPSEVVHHIDGNHANNDISNLEVFASNGEHLRATLQGIPHNVSPENRKRLSLLVKERWANGVYKPWTKEQRDAAGLRARLRWQNPEYREKTIANQKLGRNLKRSSSATQPTLDL